MTNRLNSTELTNGLPKRGKRHLAGTIQPTNTKSPPFCQTVRCALSLYQHLPAALRACPVLRFLSAALAPKN